ncbi:MAG: hypothetical protein QM742_08525 [Aquabacterium sp.]
MSMPMEIGLGLWQHHAGTWMMVSSAVGLLLFGLPMLLVPLHWARRMGWGVASQDHLAIYFGRTLGMMACVLMTLGIVSASHPAMQPMMANAAFAIYLANTGVHAWGAVRRIQPLSETLEIPFWLALSVLQLLFYPDVHWRWA